MNKQTQLKQILKENKEGFSVSFNDLKSYNKGGYAVGLTNIKGKNLNLLIQKVLSVGRGFSQIHNKLYLGGWFNQEDKTFYLDLSLMIEDKQNALYMAKTFNQLAIFDLNNFKEIRV